MNSRTRTHPFRVERVSDPGSDHGQHKTEADAQKRIRRLVAMSNGKRTLADYRVVNDMRKQNPMDRDTAEHFYAWLNRSVPLDEQHQVEQDIHALLKDDPRLVETHSWPEIRRLAEVRKNPQRRKIDSVQAREILARHNALNADFHSLRSSDVQGLLDEAKRFKYRASASAPGSRARMFHQHLTRLAVKVRMNPVTRYGTHHFTNHVAAQKYYKAYGFTSKDVTRKIRAGEIAIGPPSLKAGERSSIDSDGRYHIEAAATRKNPARRARKKVRAKTRAAVQYKITAQNQGKKMHFDGRHFSERPTVKSFALAEDAKQTALALIRRYPILRKYRVRVESFP